MSVLQRGVLTLVFKGSIYVSGTEGCADLRVQGVYISISIYLCVCVCVSGGERGVLTLGFQETPVVWYCLT